MANPSSDDDFFSSLGATPPRPATKLARPPPAMGASTGATTGASTVKRAPPPVGAARPTTTAGRTTAGRTGTRPTAGRTARGTPPATGRSPAAATATSTSTQQRPTSTAGRTTAAGRGGTSSRGTAGRTRTTTGTTTAGGRGAARPVGGTGFSNPSASTSTHLSSPAGTTNATPSSNNNPYAAQNPQAMNPYAHSGASSNPYGAASPVVSSPYGQPNTTSSDTFNQWQQPQTMPMQTQQQPNDSMANQWQQPAQQQQQPQQPEQMGTNFFMQGMMSSNSNENFDNLDGNTTSGKVLYDDGDFDNEPPILEELGINLDHILSKTKAVILPFQRVQGSVIQLDPSVIVEDADLAGPMLFALALGGELLMTGKLHFGYIYGFGLFGCFAMTLLLNLMAPKDSISPWTVASILGYALLPVNVLALVKIIVVNIIRLETFGRFLALIAVLWSTVAATRLLEVGCGMRSQRYLIGYPLALLYSAFVLMTIF